MTTSPPKEALPGRVRTTVLTTLRSLPSVVAIALLVSVTIKAWVDFDMAYDSIAYHLPFAALKVGIIDSAGFQLTGTVKHYYDGFPSLGSYLKGWLWLASGRPEAVNLFSIASFACLVIYVWRVIKVPFTWVVIGLLSIPVVQVSLARNQIDLPANAFMTIVALSICEWFIRPRSFGKAKLVLAIASAALAAHLKPQMVVHVLVACAVVGVIVVLSLRGRAASALTVAIRQRPFVSATICCLAFVAAFSEVLYNWWRFGNPIYPLALQVGPFHVFDGPLPPWGLWPDPVYSAHYFQPFRWVLSVLEFRAFDFRPLPYTLGNGDVPSGAMSMHVGGYMGLAVLFSLGLFLSAVWVRRDRMGWTFAGALGLITILSALPPGSHEIRYFSYWMMFLVVATLILLTDPARPLAREARIYKLFLLCELLYVLLITGAEHLRPQFWGLSRVERTFHVDETLRQAVQGGETLCLTRHPQIAFLYAPIFNSRLAKERPYSVRAEGFSPLEPNAFSKGSSVCTWISP
jgi:hypothetical protein